MKHLFVSLAMLLGTAAAIPKTTTTTGTAKTTAKDELSTFGKRGILDFRNVGKAPPGCHNGMNWWQFKKPDWEHDGTDEGTIIAIGSPWNIGHNRDVWWRAIDGVGLKLFNKTDDMLDIEYDHCYWQNQAVVKKKGVLIANIDFFSNEPDFHVNETKTMKKYRLSKNLEAALVSEIRLLYPWREILLICMLTILLPILVGTALCYCLRGRKRRSHDHPARHGHHGKDQTTVTL